MSPEFLKMPAEDQADILRAASGRLGRDARVLEKDIWVCWGLQHLFSIPDRKGMAFKGGTALSKIHQAIARFSEDIDVTIDYRDLDPKTPPLDEIRTRAQRDAVTGNLRELLAAYIHGTVKPHFEARIHETLADADHVRLDVDQSGENFRLHYVSVLEAGSDYLRDHVLIEFGGRNTTIPLEERLVTADIAPVVAEIQFPEASVDALAAERTFWEKATLIHAEGHKGTLRPRYDRWSRHWYDMAQLADLPIGTNALARRELLQSVVDHKKVFYYAADANYDACVAGGLRLVVDRPELTDRLRADYEEMVESGMFAGEPPSFDAILERLTALEVQINRPG